MVLPVDAGPGTTGSGEVLSELERSNSFVIPLDDERRWYRFHHLFGQLLRSELDRRHPELAAVYLARAAAWHEQEGVDPEEAFRWRPRVRRSRAGGKDRSGLRRRVHG